MRRACSSSSWLRIPSSEPETEAEGGEFEVEIERRRKVKLPGLSGLKIIFTKVMVAAMGCFFGCFGLKDSSRNPSANSSSSTPGVTVGAVTRNGSPLSSLLLSEENDGMPNKVKDDQDLGTSNSELGFSLKELKDEAKFLKACGTLPETPAEIRKNSEKWQDSSARNREREHPKFRSWLTDTSIEKLNLEMESDQPLTPMKDCEELVNNSGSLEHTPSSGMTERHKAGRVSTSSTEGNEIKNARSVEIVTSPSASLTGSSVITRDMASTVTCKNKSVRFDCDSDMSSVSSKIYSSEISTNNSKQYGSAVTTSIAKSSPYPTPIKLSDEMQTPGTVFPAYLDAMGPGKNARIRSQYVYSVLNPVENFSQWKVLKNEGSNSDDQNNQKSESFERTDEENSISGVGTGETLVGKELKVEASLSSWLRAPLLNPDGSVEHNGSATGGNPRFGRTPADRPILGMVAAHWNDDVPSQVSPKWWDGNGIPNSTNKYKEDQKVSWHATPFEERLEKALSEETFISQRNQTSRTPPPDFSEAEESDTATSQLQPSNRFKSVVSF